MSSRRMLEATQLPKTPSSGDATADWPGHMTNVGVEDGHDPDARHMGVRYTSSRGVPIIPGGPVHVGALNEPPPATSCCPNVRSHSMPQHDAMALPCKCMQSFVN